jgi:hypothetical protein
MALLFAAIQKCSRGEHSSPYSRNAATCGQAFVMVNREKNVAGLGVVMPLRVNPGSSQGQALTLPPIPAQTRNMAGDRIPSLILQIMEEPRARSVLITNRGGEWCVNVRGGTQATEYLTDDLQDAFEHGHALAASPNDRTGADEAA